MIDPTQLSHLRNLAYTVCPELLVDRPLYICDAEIFDGLTTNGDCLGWASTAVVIDPAMQARIPNWDGAGPLIALRCEAIRAKYGDEHFRDGLMTTMLHEVAHVVLFPRDPLHPDLLDTPEVAAWQLGKRIEGHLTPPDVIPGSDCDPHGRDFVRVVVHLLGRSKLAGWDIFSDGLFGPDCWYLCQPSHWVFACMREIVEYQSTPFSTILRLPPPAEFSRMHAAAVRFHLKLEANK